MGSTGWAEGAVGGGGSGLFVEVPSRNQLVLLDLYLANPEFKDDNPGDQINLNEIRGKDSKIYRSQFLDVSNLNSFKYMIERVRAWQKVAPNFFRVIQSGDFLNLDLNKSLHSQILPFIKTDKFIKFVDEVFLPSNFTDQSKNKSIKLYPTGYFSKEKNSAFVNIENFNRAGLISQAALFLHERLRQIQEYDSMANVDLQKIVASIFIESPKKGVIPDKIFEKSIFNHWPSYIKSELSYLILLAMEQCHRDSSLILISNELACYKAYSNYFIQQLDESLKKESDLDSFWNLMAASESLSNNFLTDELFFQKFLLKDTIIRSQQVRENIF